MHAYDKSADIEFTGIITHMLIILCYGMQVKQIILNPCFLSSTLPSYSHEHYIGCKKYI